jgi:hypothetical protein
MRRPPLTTMRVFNDFAHALVVVNRVMERGARTHRGEDWRALPAGFHLARARRHLDLLVAGDESEPHLAHAACRLLMELERDVWSSTTTARRTAVRS